MKLLATIMLFSSLCSAQTLFHFQKFCEQGGANVATQGLSSVTTVQQSFPGCTVTVYLTGTTNPATIFSDSNSTPLSNPFTANGDGSFGFFASGTACYDITTSGGNPPNTLANPFTYVGVCVGNGGSGLPVPVSLPNGGTNSSTPCASTSALFFFTGSAFNCDPNTILDGNGNLSVNAINVSAFTLRGNGTGVITVREGVPPLPPSSGFDSWYVDINTHLFSCKNSSNGSCVSGLFGAVALNPAGPQTVAQPVIGSATSALFLNNFNNIRYAQQFNWSQTPSGTVTPGSNTITLAPCPAGIDTSNDTSAPYYVYISGTGTPEAAAVTGGTCVPGASGTITLVAVNTHAAGFSIGSSSSGIVEAMNDAAGNAVSGNPNAFVWVGPTGANTNALQIYAPMFIVASKSTLLGDGAHLQCFTRSSCLHTGDNASVNDASVLRVEGLRFESMVNQPGVHITNVALTSNVITVTTDANHNFSATANAGSGDEVWAEFYSGTFDFHGMLTVASTPSGTTYTAPFTHADVGSTAAFGWTALENTAIEDNSLGTDMRNIALRTTGSNRFSYFYVIDNDQAAKIDNFDTDNGGVLCTSSFCGSMILLRGDAGNSGLAAINYSNLSMQCGGNGITNYSGNSQSVNDTVLQGYAQYGIKYVAGLQNEWMRNVYEEVGGCTNPYYPGSLQAQAGVLHMGQTLLLSGGTQASAPAGNIPTFVNTGATQNNYFVVPKTTNGTGALGLIGKALTNGSGNIVLYWPCTTGLGEGTLTYDVLRVVGSSITPPYPGQTASIAIATANSGSPSSGICTFTDTQAAASSYTVPRRTVTTGQWFWPAGVSILQEQYANTTWGTRVITDQVPPFVYSGAGTTAPTVFAQECGGSSTTKFSPFWPVCIAQDENGQLSQMATVLPQMDSAGNSPVANSKGRLNFGGAVHTTPIDLFTLMDSAIDKTNGTLGGRPTNDANDATICEDQGDAGITNVGICIRAPLSLSRYIGHVPDNSSYKERLTSTLEQYVVALQTTAVAFSSLPTCNSGAEGTVRAITDSTVNTVGSTISGSGSNHVKAYCNGTNWVVGEGGTSSAGAGLQSVELTSNYTSADGNADALPALVFTLPANTAVTYVIDCYGIYSQATATTSQVISYIASVAPSNVIATGLISTNTTALTTQAQVVTSPNTSTQNIVTATPGTAGATRAWETHMTVKEPSQASATIQMQWLSTTGGTDVTTVYQGSRCTMSTATN